MMTTTMMSMTMALIIVADIIEEKWNEPPHGDKMYKMFQEVLKILSGDQTCEHNGILDVVINLRFPYALCVVA